MILFGIGILVDSILTVFYAFRVLFPKTDSVPEHARRVGEIAS
jgi:hypothetical protein